jgi:hypothetical protein
MTRHRGHLLIEFVRLVNRKSFLNSLNQTQWLKEEQTKPGARARLVSLGSCAPRCRYDIR